VSRFGKPSCNASRTNPVLLIARLGNAAHISAWPSGDLWVTLRKTLVALSQTLGCAVEKIRENSSIFLAASNSYGSN